MPLCFHTDVLNLGGTGPLPSSPWRSLSFDIIVFFFRLAASLIPNTLGWFSSSRWPEIKLFIQGCELAVINFFQNSCIIQCQVSLMTRLSVLDYDRVSGTHTIYVASYLLFPHTGSRELRQQQNINNKHEMRCMPP